MIYGTSFQRNFIYKLFCETELLHLRKYLSQSRANLWKWLHLKTILNIYVLSTKHPPKKYSVSKKIFLKNALKNQLKEK